MAAMWTLSHPVTSLLRHWRGIKAQAFSGSNYPPVICCLLTYSLLLSQMVVTTLKIPGMEAANEQYYRYWQHGRGRTALAGA